MLLNLGDHTVMIQNVRKNIKKDIQDHDRIQITNTKRSTNNIKNIENIENIEKEAEIDGKEVKVKIVTRKLSLLSKLIIDRKPEMSQKNKSKVKHSKSIKEDGSLVNSTIKIHILNKENKLKESEELILKRHKKCKKIFRNRSSLMLKHDNIKL